MERDTAFFLLASALAILLFVLSIKIKDIPGYIFWPLATILLLGMLVSGGFLISKNLNGPFILFVIGIVILALSFAWQFWNPPSRVDITSSGIAEPSAIEEEDALARLALLGWTLRLDPLNYKFEIAHKDLPAMDESAKYFAPLRKPIQLTLQSVKDLTGLHFLSHVRQINGMTISASEFTDLSELQGFRHLTSLMVTQTPLNGKGIVDASVIGKLTNLQVLSLNMSRVRDVDFLRNLTNLRELWLGVTLVSNFSPLAPLINLEKLDIRGAPGTDLRPLVSLHVLHELTISGAQAAGLSNLADLDNLKMLLIISQMPFDVTGVGCVSKLENLSIWGPPQIDLTPVRKLTQLHAFSLSGTSLGILTAVNDFAAVGQLTSLTRLVLGHLNVTNLDIIRVLTKLEELSISQLPIVTMPALAGLRDLKKIAIADLHVADMSPLLAVPNLTDLTLIRAPVRSDILLELQRRGVNVTTY